MIGRSALFMSSLTGFKLGYPSDRQGACVYSATLIIFSF